MKAHGTLILCHGRTPRFGSWSRCGPPRDWVAFVWIRHRHRFKINTHRSTQSMSNDSAGGGAGNRWTTDWYYTAAAARWIGWNPNSFNLVSGSLRFIRIISHGHWVLKRHIPLFSELMNFKIKIILEVPELIFMSRKILWRLQIFKENS